MRNRSRGRGKPRKPGSNQPDQQNRLQGGLPPLQPMYPTDRWDDNAPNEFDERQPDSNESTIERAAMGGFSQRRPPRMPREMRDQRPPRQMRDDRQPREPRVPREPRPPREQQPAAEAGGEGQQRPGRGRRRRRGRRRDNAAAPAGEAVRPTPAVTDSSLAAALPGLAAAVPVEGEAAEGQSPDAVPEVKPVAPPVQKQPRGTVVLAIGLPGSGKSTWFKRRGVAPLSSDMLRTILFDNITEQRYQHLVFSTLRSLLRARLIARMPWNYVDATNLAPKERRHWIQMSRGFGYEVHAVFFDVPIEVCMERNRKRERLVPEEVMQRMAAKLRPPKFEEGFAKITVVRVKRAAQAAADAEQAEAEADDAAELEAASDVDTGAEVESPDIDAEGEAGDFDE